MTNKEFMHDAQFQRACDAAGVKATARQASKWRRGAGKAWKYKRTNGNG